MSVISAFFHLAHRVKLHPNLRRMDTNRQTVGLGMGATARHSMWDRREYVCVCGYKWKDCTAFGTSIAWTQRMEEGCVCRLGTKKWMSAAWSTKNSLSLWELCITPCGENSPVGITTAWVLSVKVSHPLSHTKQSPAPEPDKTGSSGWKRILLVTKLNTCSVVLAIITHRPCERVLLQRIKLTCKVMQRQKWFGCPSDNPSPSGVSLPFSPKLVGPIVTCNYQSPEPCC